MWSALQAGRLSMVGVGEYSAVNGIPFKNTVVYPIKLYTFVTS